MNYQHIGQMINEKVQEYGDNPALRFKKEGKWETLTYTQFGEKIRSLSYAMIKSGVKQGDSVGIYSTNRYEWAVTDFACILVGAVSVPIYATNTMDQARFIIEDANIKLIFSGNEEQYRNLANIHTSGVPLKIITYGSDHSIEPEFTDTFDKFLYHEGQAGDENELKQRTDSIGTDDVSTIIYTSGTTGNPKGVMLTHRNLFHQFESMDANFEVGNKDTSLCFLPLSHVYERMWSYYVYMKGAYHAYLEDPKQIIENPAGDQTQRHGIRSQAV